MGVGVLFPGHGGRGVKLTDQLRPSNAEVLNSWSYTSPYYMPSWRGQGQITIIIIIGQLVLLSSLLDYAVLAVGHTVQCRMIE